MSENLERSILPSLRIQMSFASEPLKKSQSSASSPRTLPETPIHGLKRVTRSRGELVPLSKVADDSPSHATETKVKGLEAIGLFSEFAFSKQITHHCETQETFKRQQTIHITDFMTPADRRRILLQTGGVEAYHDYKQKFQKELLLRDKKMRNFFHNQEKKPEFFCRTPPISPKTANGIREVSRKGGERAEVINSIIEKCDKAMMIKPPTNLPKSMSPRAEDVGKIIKRRIQDIEKIIGREKK
jgi:hypothetical protein